MGDRAVIGWGIVTLLLISLACNAFAGRSNSALPPAPNPTILPSVEAAVTQPPVLAPTATLPGQELPVPAQGYLRILVDLNIRSGPGVRYERVGFLLRDDRVAVEGRDIESGWWKIQCPESVEDSECWVSGGAQYTRPEAIELLPTPAEP